MTPREFDQIFKPTQAKIDHGADVSTFLLKDSFSLSTLALFGAVAQVVLFAILPFRWAVVPPAILSLNALITTAIQALNPTSNRFVSRIIPGRVSAQLPSRNTGRSGPIPATEQVVVFHLGVQYNHPLGLLAPGASEVASRFQEMNEDLKARADEYGLLNASMWRGSERGSNNTLMLVYYFRDMQILNKFAHDPLHRKTWDWFNKVKSRYPYLGILHEAFVAAPKSYEGVYVNCNPVLMGRASIRCKTEEGEAWVNPLVNADVMPLRSQFARMGQAVNEE